MYPQSNGKNHDHFHLKQSTPFSNKPHFSIVWHMALFKYVLCKWLPPLLISGCRKLISASPFTSFSFPEKTEMKCVGEQQSQGLCRQWILAFMCFTHVSLVCHALCTASGMQDWVCTWLEWLFSPPEGIRGLTHPSLALTNPPYIMSICVYIYIVYL